MTLNPSSLENVPVDAGPSSSGEIAIPGYQLLNRAGEGGRGTVYRAMQLSLDRVVAVKILHAADGIDAVPAFHRESRLLASLSHPHIVAIHDCGHHQGRYYLITEFITGSSLRSAMTPSKPWPMARAAELLDRVAEALSYIHQHGILHLDLKPENVLCTPDGGVKIADFGLALSRLDARALAELGLAQGTIDYCAPEQRYGLQTDERSDLFSLGVLAYELLTGRLPSRIYQSAVRLNPRLPMAVDPVLRRALSRRPEQRFGSIAEFRHQLQTALGCRRSTRRSHVLVLAALAMMLLLLPALYRKRSPQVDAPSDQAAPFNGPRPRGWLIYDDPESLRWLGELGGDALPNDLAALLTRKRIKGRQPQGPNDPPLPEWPQPLPALLLDSPRTQVLVHPLNNSRLADWVWSHWGELSALQPLPAEDNFIRAGDFDCPADFPPDSTRWRLIRPWEEAKEDSVRIEDPPDRPGNPALHLIKQSPQAKGEWMRLYQWLSRTPERPGRITLFRFSARADKGEGRLLIGPVLPLMIRRDDRGPTAHRLRAVSVPHPHVPSDDVLEARELQPGCWVRPGKEWRTYLFVWDWPDFCTYMNHRNVLLAFAGLGEVWIDDVEMFAWDLGVRP